MARLARLALTDEERRACRQQLGRILESMRVLEKYDTSRVPPTTHVAALANVFRPDEAHPCQNMEALLANAPEREDNFFKVKKIIE